MIFVICMKTKLIYENKDQILVLPGDVIKIQVRVTEPGYLRLQFSHVPTEKRTFEKSYVI